MGLWLDYVRYLLEEVEAMNESEGEDFISLSKIRDSFERALTVAGLHFSEAWIFSFFSVFLSLASMANKSSTSSDSSKKKGSKLWETYIEFEKIVEGDLSTNPQQVTKVRSLYHRFLKVPHRGNLAVDPIFSISTLIFAWFL